MNREFTNPTNQKKIILKDYINCRTQCLVYGLQCPCLKIYVSQTTQELMKRVQQHLSTISLAKRDFGSNKKSPLLHNISFISMGGRMKGIWMVGLTKIMTNIRKAMSQANYCIQRLN